MNEFELALTLPGDPRYCETLRAVATHAAFHAGCKEPRAAQFGAEVEDALRSCLDGNQSAVGILFRQDGDELHVTLTPGSGAVRTLRIGI